MTLIGENDFDQTPSVDELMGWAEEYGITHPVVADPDMGITWSFVTGSSIGLPSMHIVRAGGEISAVDIWADEGDVTANLP
jgi:hypothetical protein